MPAWALYTIGVVIFAFGLLFSIALHEVGHMVPAKKFGVKVTQYMVGFGPTIFSRKRGDTEYGIKAVPLGGYIRMIGMVPPRPDGSVSRWPRRMATAVEDFRQVSRAEIDPQDEERQFYRLTPGKRMIVMFGGPSMNLLIYLVLTVILFSTLGLAHSDPTTTVSTISKCLVPANSTYANDETCPANATATPALNHLEVGDKIVAVNGTTITSWDQLVGIIQPSAGKQLDFTVIRDGVRTSVEVTPVDNENYVNGTDKISDVGFVGIAPASHDYYEAVPLGSIPGQIGTQIRQGWDRLMSYPARIGNLFGTVFDGQKRSADGAVGIVGIGRLGGDIARSKQLDTDDKIVFFVELLASVNLLLFFFNLLPLLPLDGGHVAGALLEAIKRGRARMRRDPERRRIFVDTAQMLPVMYVVGSLIIALSVLTLYADIVDPINLPTG